MDENQMSCNNAAIISLIGCLWYAHKSKQVISNLIYLVQKINWLPPSRKASELSHLHTSSGSNRACPSSEKSSSSKASHCLSSSTAGRKVEKRWVQAEWVSCCPKLSIVNILYLLLKPNVMLKLFFFKAMPVKWSDQIYLYLFPLPSQKYSMMSHHTDSVKSVIHFQGENLPKKKKKFRRVEDKDFDAV